MGNSESKLVFEGEVCGMKGKFGIETGFQGRLGV
jgi:hypothetical protein